MNLLVLFSFHQLAFSSPLPIQHDIRMVTDVLRSFEMPLSVAALLTWPEVEQRKFGRLMANNNTPLTFLHTSKQFKPSHTDNRLLIIIDLENEHAYDYLKNAATSGSLALPYRWLVINKNPENTSTVPTSLNDLAILPNSEVIVASLTSKSSYDLRLIYKVKQDTPWLQEYFGNWTVTRGVEMSPYMRTTALAIRRKDLQGASLVTATVGNSDDTSTELRSIKDITTNNYYKIAYYQTLHMYEFLNITCVMKLSRSWGFLANGTWSGLVGEVVHGNAQFGGQVMFFTKQRLEVLDYLSQPVTASVVFVFREPRLSYQNNLFLLPFRASVWYSIVGFTFIIIFILYITAKWEQHSGEDKTSSQDASWLRPDFGDITIVAVSAIAQQGTAAELKGGRGRVVIFLLFLTFLFLYTAYSASIVVLLQTSSNQIRTLKDLLNSKLELGVEDTAFNRHYFMTATEPVRKAIYEKKIVSHGKPRFLSMPEGVRKLQTEPFAFNMYTPIGYRVIDSTFHEHEKCGLREIPYIQDNKPWYTCKKNSPYKELYKLGLYRCKEHGLVGRANSIFFRQKPPCSVRGGSFVSVNIVDFYPALLVLLYGMACSLLLLIVEIFAHSRNKCRVLT